MGADQAFCLVSLGWYLSGGVVSFVCPLDSVVYEGREFGDCCLVVDLVDLDRVGELDEWWYVRGGVLLLMCLCEVCLSFSAGYLDAVVWLKSQLKRVGSSFSGEYDFRCLESLSC